MIYTILVARAIICYNQLSSKRGTRSPNVGILHGKLLVAHKKSIFIYVKFKTELHLLFRLHNQDPQFQFQHTESKGQCHSGSQVTFTVTGQKWIIFFMLNIPIFAPNLVSFPIHNNENSCQKRWLPYIGGGEGWGICVNWECHVLIYSPSCTSSIVNFHLFKITLDKPIYRVLTLFKECNSMTFQ